MRLSTITFMSYLLVAPAVAGDTAHDATKLAPTAHQLQEIKYISAILREGHYLKPKLDAENSERLLERFLASLDADHQYFLADDITDLRNQWIGNAIQAFYRLEQPFAAYERYSERWQQRYTFAIAVVDRVEPLTQRDVQDAITTWPASLTEQNQRWQAQVADDLRQFIDAGLALPDARTKLKARYIRALSSNMSMSSERVFAAFANALCASVDPGTAYFPPPQDLPAEQLNQEGIGMVLETDGIHARVSRLVESGPAMMSGRIKPGDKLVSIGDGNGTARDVVAMRLDEVVQLIRGPQGSEVVLGLVRDTTAGPEPFRVSLKRARVGLKDQTVQLALLENPGNQKERLAYIRVPKLYKDFAAANAGQKDFASAANDVRKALVQATQASAQGLLLDLRGNGGGALDEVAAIADLFIDNGPVLQERNSRGEIALLNADHAGIEWTAPVVVLVDERTASGAEMLAAALQDHQRAVVIGRPTFGVSTIQMVLDLNRYKDKPTDPMYGQLKLTVHKMYRITGKSIQLTGVTPDIEVHAATVDSAFRESDKKYPLGDETVPTLNFTPFSPSVSAYKAELSVQNAKHQENSAQPSSSEAGGWPRDALVDRAILVLANLLSMQSAEN